MRTAGSGGYRPGHDVPGGAALRRRRATIRGHPMAGARRGQVSSTPEVAPVPTTADPLVAVVIPTYHRPIAVGRAVRSVLAQSGAEHAEIVVVLSDPSSTGDRQAAAELSMDGRVRVVEATAPGPAAARNAGLRAVRAPLVALLDDDCDVQAGWLEAGVRALERADLVQGRTLPERERRGYERSLWIDRMTGLWESCNLFVRREAVEA